MSASSVALVVQCSVRNTGYPPASTRWTKRACGTLSAAWTSC